MPGENLKAASRVSVTFQELWRDTLRTEQLYIISEAERWGVTRAAFVETLSRSAAKRFGDIPPSIGDVASYLESLHLQDLALACGCSQGNSEAWEYFFQNYREVLYAAARAIIGRASINEAQARDLADSLYGDLYGGNLNRDARSGESHSLFVYFHGRSKLATWLRAVLAQRHVDGLRARRRTEPLDRIEYEGVADGQGCPAASFGASRFVSPDPDRERVVGLMQEVLIATLSALSPRDRLRLALYYVQDLTLAQIGRMFGEHEATVSRHLERTRKDVRCQVEEALRIVKHLSEAEIRSCFSVAQDEWPFDLTKALEAEPPLASGNGLPSGPRTQRENSEAKKDRYK